MKRSLLVLGILATLGLLWLWNHTDTRIPLDETRPIHRSQIVDADPLTDVISLRLRRSGVGTVKTGIVLLLDGKEYRLCGGSSSRDDYALTCTLPWGFLGARQAPTKRIGETVGRLQYFVELAWVRGTVDIATMVIHSTTSPAPSLPFHNSVAFDAQTDAIENSGDGALAVSHTATGSDRAGFISVGNARAVPSTADTPTYGGGGTVSSIAASTHNVIWNHAMFKVVAPATGAQTVTSTLSGGSGTLEDHYLGVITMTGVDQTTPVGTHQFASGTGTSATVTVTGTTSDGLLCDFTQTRNSAPVVGANQTERGNRDSPFPTRYRTSTQASSDGGEMSWTYTAEGSQAYALGAIEFKAVSAGVTFTPKLRIY